MSQNEVKGPPRPCHSATIKSTLKNIKSAYLEGQIDLLEHSTSLKGAPIKHPRTINKCKKGNTISLLDSEEKKKEY